MKLTDSITLEELQSQLEQDTFTLIPPDRALEHLQVITLQDLDARRWCQGQRLEISPEEIEADRETGDLVRVKSKENNLLGIGEISSLDRLLIPKIVLENL
jgi:tRNA pseudouridine55 synthase